MLLRFLDAKMLLAIVLVAWAINAGIINVNLRSLKRAVISVISFGSSAAEEGVQMLKDSH